MDRKETDAGEVGAGSRLWKSCGMHIYVFQSGRRSLTRTCFLRLPVPDVDILIVSRLARSTMPCSLHEFGNPARTSRCQ